MLVVLILGVLAVFALVTFLLQRNQSRKLTRTRYFSHTLGVSDPAPAQAEDENPRLL